MFVTPSGRLETSDYSWTLGDLAADTDYLLQTRVEFDEGTTDLQGGLHELHTPPLPTRESRPTPRITESELRSVKRIGKREQVDRR